MIAIVGSLRRAFIGTGMFMMFASPLAAQSITANITSTTAPTGTATAPHYVIDSDAVNGNAGYTRDTIPGSVTVKFDWVGPAAPASETYRAIADLVDSNGNAIPLSASGVSNSQVVELSPPFNTTTTRNFNLSVDPSVDLGAGAQYRLRFTIQRYTTITLGGQPIQIWLTADGPDTSSAFTVVHFTDNPENTSARYVRGYLRGAPTWQKAHAVQTGTTAAQSFQVLVPYTQVRYDVGGTTAAITNRYTVEMVDDLGNPVPLQNGGVGSINNNRNAFDVGTPNTPAIVNLNQALNFRPTTQLDVRNRTYRVRVTFEHLEIPTTSTYLNNGTSAYGSLNTLLHFNGNLRFGPSIGGLNTVFSAYSNTPTAGTFGFDLVTTTLNVTAGTIPGFPNYTFGNGSPLGVQLLSNGNAVVTSGSHPVSVAGGGEVSSDFAGTTVVYPGTVLTGAGPVADSATVRLPQGLSYTPNRATAAKRYLSEVALTGPFTLTNLFRHTGDLGLALPANAWAFDEARPLLYQVSSFLFRQNGEIEFVAADAEWAQKPAFDQLQAQQSSGLHHEPSMADRMSNDGYLRFARIAPGEKIRFAASSADTTNRCTAATLEITGGQFTTHFPLNTPVVWASLGQLQIDKGIVKTGSKLVDVAMLRVDFDGSCADDACGPAGGAVEKIEITPSGDSLLITSDGGLQADGSITPNELRWGIRGDASFTHRSDKFNEASFLASGHHLYDAQSPIAKAGPQVASAGSLGPCVITLAGYNPGSPTTPVYSGSLNYRNGVGVWPGATLVANAPGQVGASFLADQTEEYPYLLQEDVTKYYVRRSGVSGRHVAEKDSFNPDLVLYDYFFQLTRFQLTFLSNENERSWVNGSVFIPEPSDFTQSFTGLRLSCTGALEGAEIDPSDSDKKNLRYWNGSIQPLAMAFAPEEGAGCYADRFLTLGVISGAANIDSPLAGVLAFKPNGDIGTLGDNIVGADGRLGLPAKVPLAGPGNESYTLNPVTKLYFNSPNTPGAPLTGFVSFAATCGVPYFEDLELHVMTSAQAGVPAPVYLASNWTSGGQSHFTNTRFDELHRGFPVSISASEYQNPTTATPYLVHAQQSIFGLVDLDYPLRWSPSSRYFESWEGITDNLLVLTAEHQIDYLSADNAEISFGAKYDGLPKISLASAATDIVDGQLGAARALTEAAESFVTDTLNQGVDEIGNLINDSMETLLDRALDEIETQAINPLYVAIRDAYDNADQVNDTYTDWLDQSNGDLKAAFDAHLLGIGGNAANNVKSRLQQLSDANAEASSLVQRVADAVDSGILAIDSLTGQLQTYRDAAENTIVLLEGAPVPAGFSPHIPVNGLLAEIPGPDGPERQIVQKLVRELVRELAPPDIAAILVPLLENTTSELNGQLNELLTKFDPTLDRITEVLIQARGYLEDIKSQLESGIGIFQSFEDIISSAEMEIDTMMAEIRSTAYAYIDGMVAAAALPTNVPLEAVGNVLNEFNQEEFVAFIRAELRDRLLATNFIRSIQYQLRQTISEFDIALRSAIDSAFAEVNRVCRELIKEALGPIDDKINGLLGNINSVVGAGSIDGYVHIQGDTLRRLRIDAMVELKVPDALKLQGYFEMLCYDSSTDTGSSSCLTPGEEVVEVRIGAIDVPLDWISPDLRANLDVWFSLKNTGTPADPEVSPLGIGGGFEMTGGVLDFQSFKITKFAAGVAFGANENYLAATATVIISSYEASGGIFFGKTCSIAPLEMVDPDVAAVLGSAPFTGAYVYGEVWLPISETLLGIPASCFFRISAGVGAGAFYFVEGPTYGGKMLLGASGEALCLVSIKGTVTMVGVMQNGALSFSGKGKLTGKAGACPFCIKFSKSASVKYQNGSWSVDL